ncbi:hypothetical protein Mgra_00004103 [Meloidogyne graminicola]|nr:hypothetical protein Mgra_00004103 [Meloidogyne graminicola]
MGEISDKTKIGIITFIDKRYNYVWNTNLGPLELRFPLNPQLEFKPGEIVRYVQSHDGLAPQIVHNLLRYDKKQLKVERGLKIPWKIEVNLVFASPTSKEFKEAMENDDEDRLKGIAWTQDFLLVASYLDGVEYKPGVVYRAYITRIPNRWEPLARKVGSIFVIIGKKFEKCTNQDELATFWKYCPWKIETSSNEDCDIGLPLNSASPINDCNETSNRNDFSSNIVYEEQLPNFAEALNNINEGEEKIGLVVICEKEYSVIWNPVDDLVRVQVGQLLEDGNDNLSMWPLCEWVKYRCMPEESQISNNVVCKYTAYDIKKTKAINEVTRLKDSVAVKCRLSSAKAYSSSYFIAKDSFFQSVLCSCQDRILKEQMEDENVSIDVYAIFTDIYKNIRWIAFAFRDKDCWRKIDGLTPTVDSQIRPFFTRFENRTSVAYETMQNDLLATNRFKAPIDWKGCYSEGQKIVDVIGIVVCFEDETTVIATKFGLARQPIKFPLGVWVLATIVPDERTSQSPKNNFMRGLGSFIIKRSEKIGPVMSTRVVHDKVDKLLLCCPVKANASRSFVNEYLGKVDDPDNLVKPQQNGQFCPSGYLVELCLSRSREDNSRFWKILKNHGEYNKNVNIVALKLSFFPHEEGQTCDDAHTVLLDRVYDADELLTKQKEESKQNNIQNNSTTFKSVPNGSSYWEAVSANNKQQAFANTLPYQPPKFPNICPQNPDTLENFSSQQQTSSLSSKSYQNIKPSTSITSNNEIDDCSNLIKQLSRYQPIGESKRQIGIVVAKNINFAILYTKLYGDAIVLPRYMQSQEQFDELFMLGRFIGASFSRVNDPVKNELTYKMMCLPEFKLNNKNIVKTRVVLGQFVQAYVECDFSKENIKECNEEMKECTENERRYYIETAIGYVLLNNEVIDKNDFLGKVVNLWLAHIQKRYGCSWQIALNEMNTLQGNYLLEYEMIKNCHSKSDEQINNPSTS